MVEQPQQSVRNFLLWDSYNKKDKQLYFGRDRETKLLYDKTFASNLLLLYGPSGAGKTSLIQCGLGNMFEDSDWYPIFIRKGDNIVRSLSTELRNAAEESEKLRNNSIREKIHHLFLEKFRPIFLIFDQFEELFILGNREEQDQFFRLLLELLDVNFQCKIILSIKEDYLADLDRYEEAIPMLFYNRMRVERMRTEQLEEIVLGMSQHMGIQVGSPDDGPPEQEKIMRDLFKKVRDDTQRVDLGELQLFMDELYNRDEQRRIESGEPMRLIRFDRPLIRGTEYVDIVIARRLQKHLEDIDLKFKHKAHINRLPYLVLRELVTELETKHTQTVEVIDKHLLKQHGIKPEFVDECVRDLVEVGILRNLSKSAKKKKKSNVKKGHKVEIVHDNLAKKLYPLLFSEERNIIRVKNFIAIQYETFEEAGVKLSKEDLEYIQPYLVHIRDDIPPEHMNFVHISRRTVKQRELRLGIFLGGLSLVLLVSTIIAVILWSQSSRASRANNISAQALNALSYDRTLALRLSEIALEADEDNALANNVMNDVLISASTYPFYQDIFEIQSQSIDRISDLDVSENGKYLLAGSLDGGLYLLHLWNADGLKSLHVKEGDAHKEEITDVDFIGEFNKRKYCFLTTSKDSTAKVWYIAGGDSLATLMYSFPHHSSVSTGYFYQSNDTVAVFTADEHHVFRWQRSQTANLVWKKDSFNLPYTNSFERLEFEEDTYLVAAGWDTTLRITKINRPYQPIYFQRIPGEAAVMNMDFSDQVNGGKFVAGLDDGRLITWSLDGDFLAGKKSIANSNYQSREAHAQAIKDVVIINDGAQILTSSEDKSAKLWDANIGLLKTFLGHNDGVQTITSAEEGEIIYTGGEDKTIKKWKLDLIQADSLEQGNNHVFSMALASEQNKLLITSHHGETERLFLFSGENLSEKEELEPESDITRISASAFSPDGEQILLASEMSPALLLVDLNGGIDSLPYSGARSVTHLAYSQDGAFIVATSKDSARIWKKQPEAADQFEEYAVLGPELQLAELYHEEGTLRLLSLIKGGNKAYLWEIPTANTSPVLLDSVMHTDEILSFAISPDGEHLLTGSKDNSFFHGENLDSPLALNREQRHTADVNFVTFAPGPSPHRFLTASQDGTLRLWNINGREEKSFIHHGKPILKALFLSDHLVLTLGSDGLVKIWHTEDIEDFVKAEEKNIFAWGEEEKKELVKE